MNLEVPSSDGAATIKMVRRSLSSIFTFSRKKPQPPDSQSPSSSTSVIHDPLALGDRTSASRVASTNMRNLSVPSFVDASVPPLAIPISALSLPPVPKSPPPVPGELADIDNASAEELRKALKIRNEQYRDLVCFVVTMSKMHIAAAERFRVTSSEVP